MCFPHVETNYYQIRIHSTAGAGTAGTAAMTEVMVVKTLVFPSQLCLALGDMWRCSNDKKLNHHIEVTGAGGGGGGGGEFEDVQVQDVCHDSPGGTNDRSGTRTSQTAQY